jgi:hypothetical protein
LWWSRLESVDDGGGGGVLSGVGRIWNLEIGIFPSFGIISEVMFDDYLLFSPVQGRLMSEVWCQNDRQGLSYSLGSISLLLSQLSADLLPVDVSRRPALLVLLGDAPPVFGILPTAG